LIRKRNKAPIIHRPFEEAQWFNAIGWPFRHWQASRFSDGSFGVWYGCGSEETSIHETAYHWVTGLLRDAGFDKETVIAERQLYEVACHAALLDFRAVTGQFAGLIHPSDYSFAQSAGARLHREGHPGLLTMSVRHRGGENYAILNPSVLSQPKTLCQLTYRLDTDRVVVEKQPGVTLLELSTEAFDV